MDPNIGAQQNVYICSYKLITRTINHGSNSKLEKPRTFQLASTIQFMSNNVMLVALFRALNVGGLRLNYLNNYKPPAVVGLKPRRQIQP